MRGEHMKVPVTDEMHLTGNFRSRLPKYVIKRPTTNDMRSANHSFMKAVLGITSALKSISRVGKMGDIYPLTVFRVQTILILLRNDIVFDAVALSSMTLFLTALRHDEIALGGRIDMLEMSFFLLLSMFQEQTILADQNHQPPDIGSANDRVTLLRKEALIGCGRSAHSGSPRW
jgi:hypothetical protein